MIPIDNFLAKHQIKFNSDKDKIRWFKNRRPKSLIRIGISYFVDENEMDFLLEKYIAKLQTNKIKQRLNAKRNLSKSNLEGGNDNKTKK